MQNLKIIVYTVVLLVLAVWVVGEPTEDTWYSEHLFVFLFSKFIALGAMYGVGCKISELFNQNHN